MTWICHPRKLGYQRMYQNAHPSNSASSFTAFLVLCCLEACPQTGCCLLRCRFGPCALCRWRCVFFLLEQTPVGICMYVCMYIYIISYILYYIHVVIICYYYNSFIDLTRGHPWVIWMSFSTASNRWDVQVPPGATQQLPSCNQLENPEFIDHFHQFPWIFIYFPMNKWGFPRWLQQASWTMWAR